jgi:hypothetical protein
MRNGLKLLAVALVAIMVAMFAIPLIQNADALPTGYNEKKLSSDVVPQGIAVAVDSNGKVHIVGYDYNNGAHLVYMDDVSGSWSSPHTIDVCAGTPPVIAVDSNGYSHIVYVKQNFSLMYVTNAGGSWANTTIFTDSHFGHYEFSIAVDHNNKVHIAFSTNTDFVVKHATNAGGSWATENLTSGTNYGSQPSIAIDSNNKVHIACMFTGSTIGLAYLQNTTGTWSSTMVDGPHEYRFISMVLDHNNKAHIAYETSYNAIHYATDTSGAWVNTTVSSFAAAASSYQYVPVIVVDSANNPSIAYCNTTSDSTYFAEVATKSGSAWTVSRLGVGFSVGMGINSNDKLYVAYNRSGIVLDSNGTITSGNATDTSVPGPCTSVKATAGNNKVTVTWSVPSTGGTAINAVIYKSSTNSMPSSSLITVGISTGQYIDNSAENNETYYYWVVASNSDGAGSAVATGSVTPSANASTPTPSTSSNLGGLIVIIVIVVVVVLVIFMVVRRMRKRKVA